MIELGVHLLGRTLEHDPASRGYEHPVRRLATKRNVHHKIGGAPLNQERLGKCEGETGVEWCNWSKAVRNRVHFWSAKATHVHPRSYLGDPEGTELYSLATRLDDDGIPGHYPPTDTGTSGVGVAKAMQTDNAITGYDWTFSMDAMLGVLQTSPIMFGTNWYDSMFEVDSNGYVVGPPPSADPVGGHAFLGFVLDWTHERVGCTNHWTGEWGVKIGQRRGCFWIRMSFLERILIGEQGDSMIPRLATA